MTRDQICPLSPKALLSIDIITLPFVGQTCDLDLLFDSPFSFVPHIQYMAQLTLLLHLEHCKM